MKSRSLPLRFLLVLKTKVETHNLSYRVGMKSK